MDRAGVPCALKVLTPVGEEDERAGGAALRWFAGAGAGAGAVPVLEADAHGLLMPLLSGPDLVALAATDDAAATARIIATVRKLHAAQPEADLQAALAAGMTPLKDRFASLLKPESANRWGEHRDMFERGARQAQELLATARNETVLHGDLHHANIMYDPRYGDVAIDPKGLVGERSFDLANVVVNPQQPELVLAPGRAARLLDQLASGLDLDRDRLQAFTFAYCCLSAVWSLEDQQDPSLAVQVAKLLDPGSA